MIEITASTAIGYFVAVATQIAVFPFFGFEADVSDHASVAGVFTAVSIIRGYAVRRMFNWISLKMAIRKWETLD